MTYGGKGGSEGGEVGWREGALAGAFFILE